jgi:hypothetical protein
MIVWEEVDEGMMRARAGYNKQGVYHNYDSRFYATVTESADGITYYLVEFYDSHPDRQTGDYRLLFGKSGKENDIFDAQLAVEGIIYQAMANEAMAELEASKIAYESYLEGAD